MAVVMALSTVFSCQKDYDNDIEQLQKDLSSLQETVKNLTYVKSITMDDKGVLTITPSTGSAITYDATKYVKYDIEVKNGNEIYVNGEKVGTIDTPEVKDPTISVVNNELLVNGKSQDPKVILPSASAATSCVAIVKDAEGKIVSVTLKDGENEYSISTSSALTSLVFIPEVYSDLDGYGMDNISMIPVIAAKDAKEAKKDDAKYDEHVSGYILPKYRVNPSNVDITKVDWSMVGRWVELKSAEGDVDAFAIKNVEKYGSSAIAVKAILTVEGAAAMFKALPDKEYGLALPTLTLCGATKNNDGDAVEVYSDHAVLAGEFYKAGIADKKATEAKADGTLAVKEYAKISELSDLEKNSTAAHYKVAYDEKDVDLLDYVLAVAYADDEFDPVAIPMSELNYEDYDFKFESVSYKGEDDQTDQSYFVKLEGSKFTPNQGVSGINRKPIFYVQMFDKETGNILAEAYIKFQIEREVAPVEQPKKEISDIAAKQFNYNEMFVKTGDDYANMDTVIVGYTWEQMNALYNELGLDHNTFREAYKTDNVKIETVVNNDNTKYGKAAKFIFDVESENVDTYAFKLAVNPYSKFGENTAVTTITPTDKTKPIIVINWKWNVVKPTLTLDVIEGYRYNGSTTTAVTKGMRVSNAYKMQIYFGEAYNYAPALKAIFGDGTKAKMVNGSTFDLVLAKAYADKKITMNGKAYGDVLTGVTGETLDKLIGSTTGEGVLLGLEDKLKEVERVYDLRFRVNYINGEKDSLDRAVVFQNPITITKVEDNVLVDNKNGAADVKDFAANYNVYFNGKLMVKGGKAMTGKPAYDGEENTVNAADFVNVNAADYGSFFELVSADPIQYRDVTKVSTSAKDGRFQWKNAGTLLTSEVVASYVTYTFKTSFSEASIVKSEIKVKPE